MTAYPKMDPAFKAKWVEALRSGKFRQGDGALARLKNKRYEYCCLGVACAIQPTIERTQQAQEGVYESVTYGLFDGEQYYLSEAQRKAIGLDYHAGQALATMNDDGATFAQIADWIEANL